MKIGEFSINLDSSRTFTQTQTTEVSNTSSFGSIMNNVTDPALQNQGDNATSTWQEVGTVSLSRQFKNQLNNLRQIAQEILQKFTRQVTSSSNASVTSLNQVYTGTALSSNFSFLSHWENTQTTTITYEEHESVSVSAAGTVHTADDRQIDFSMDLLMERQYFNSSQTSITEKGYVLIDPLVIRTGADTPMLQGGQFSFDLDCDGETEDLAGLSDGYAFLALDLNQDGIINDGSELFGPTTGDGFQELADYDEDNNMWIDENDAMFDQFVLWNPSDDQGTRLTRLKDADVGAIYLGEVSSLFSLSSNDQQTAGQITDTSLALTESGGVMPVYEMDYKV